MLKEYGSFTVTDTPVRFEKIDNRFLGGGLLRAEQVKLEDLCARVTNFLLVFCHGDAAETKHLDVKFL